MKKILLLLAAGTMLSACNSNYVPGPDIKLESHYKARDVRKGKTIAPDTKWWANFSDPVLNSLINEALASNISVEQARERIREARFSARIIKGGYFPSLNGQLGATDGESTTKLDKSTIVWVPNHPAPGNPFQPMKGHWAPTGNRPTTTDTSAATAGLAATWTLDFGARPSAEQQTYLVEAQKEGLNSTRLDIIAGVTNAYLNVQGLGQQIIIAQKSLAVQNNTAEITKAKLEAGSVSALDSTRATAQASLTAADIPQLEQARQQAINQIAVLLGREPAEVGNIFKFKSVRYPRVKFSEGIPADLLRNRPDVRVAQLQLQAQMAAIGVAEAEQYPSLTLSGNVGVSTNVGSNTGTWSFGPSINIPIFQGGRIKANINLNKSEARIAYLQYKQTVLTAVQDVEDAMIAVRAEQERHARLTKAVADLTKAEALARQLNESGTTEFKDVLDAQADLYNAELSLAQSTQQVNLNYVALCQALGGGWFGDEPVMSEDTIKLFNDPTYGLKTN
jgi:NodT family efflux transporter outer membrane factor (OMF) lipoprotein